MDYKERFDQIESLLVGMMQRLDRMDQFNTRQEQFNARQEQFNTGISEQMAAVIGILKMSAEATRQSEERQEKLMRQLEAQGRRTDATQAEILRMMEKWDRQDAHNEATEKRLDSHEPRIQRLEDETFRQAS